MPERSIASSKGRWPVDRYATEIHAPDVDFERAKNALVAFLDELATWNAKLDLTAAKTPTELCDLMLADACALASALPRDVTVVDVGTGAGGPAVPLALLRPDLRMTLVEPLAKRTSFLRTVLAKVGRSDVAVVRARGEDCAEGDQRWDVAMSRATLAPPAWLELGVKLAKPGGLVAVLLAKEAPPSAPPSTREGGVRRWALTHDVHYALIGSGAERTLALYRMR